MQQQKKGDTMDNMKWGNVSQSTTGIEALGLIHAMHKPAK